MIPYLHEVTKMSDGGLQLNLPPDLVKPSQYPYLTNAVSRVEGRLESREGITLVCNVGGATTPIHTIFRLNQYAPGIVGERLFGVDTSLYSAPLPDGDTPSLLTGGFNFNGSPLSIIAYRFDADPQNWAIIANAQGMMKRKDGYYQQLGLPAPQIAAVATSGGAGNLTGDYDWRYTYVNPVTNSESNPSPISVAGPSMATSIPSSSTTPYTGTDAFANPANAYNGNPVGSVGTINSAGRVDCIWDGFSALPGTASSVQLAIDNSCSSIDPDDTIFHLYYSLDGGTTWNTIYQIFNTDRARVIDYILLPNGVDLTKLIIWASARRVDNASTSTMTIFNIIVNINLSGSTAASIPLASQSAIICVVPPTDPQETHLRLYRRGGSLTDNWYFVLDAVVADLVVGVCGAGTLEIDDNYSDASIEAGNTLQLDNDMPVSSVQVQNQPLIAIWAYDERVLGCGDPARPESVYFSKRGNADEWPPQNWVDIAQHGDEAMSGIVYSLRCFVFSRERMVMLLPNIIQGATFSPAETSCRRGLKGRWALTAGEKGIYFVSKDGIYRTQGGPEESVIDDSIRPLFPTLESPTGVTVNGYQAFDMDAEDNLRMTYHNSEVWVDYLGLDSQTMQRIIFDERRNRWRAAIYTPLMEMFYSEPGVDSSLLMGSIDGNIYKAGGVDDDGDPLAIHFRTGSFDQGVPLNLKEYANVAIDIDPGGADGGSPVTITPYLNGNALASAAITVTGSGRQRYAISLGDVYALNLSLDFAWDADADIHPIVYQTDIEYRLEPSAQKHWEVPPTSLGMQGWGHVRDCYVTLRSSANVTLTLTPDTYSAQTFTIPSTAGLKRKVYVPFAANKFKVMAMALDSSADFRLYSDECELRYKQWLTKLGYQVAPIFGSEQGAS